MSIAVKSGVEFAVIAPAGFLILEALKTASKTLAFDLTLTSGTDGVHSGPMDPHHLGNAYDVRSHDLAPDARAKVVDAVMAGLGWQHFFGFLEAPGTPDEHFHFQSKRGTTFTVEDFLAF
jgi:hypothetical protein